MSDTLSKSAGKYSEKRVATCSYAFCPNVTRADISGFCLASSPREAGEEKVAAISSKGTVKIKGIGKTIITVSATATNEYKAAVKKITLTVLPKTTTIKALKNTKKNKLTVTWKKNSTVTGYIIQYAANKNFKNAKTVTVKGRAKTSKTVSVKKGKTYYVRIRTYKGNLKSSWSKVMTKKISK